MANQFGLSLLLSLLLALAPHLVTALCECGYVARGPNGGNDSWVFANSLESNFNNVKNISLDADWVRQQFNVSAEAGRGKYGKAFMLGNVDIVGNGQGSVPGADSAHESTGLDLRVGSVLVNGAVPGAELDTAREDLFYGSYRTGMKLTAVNGTCAAFFWYFNDTQEIDMEFLSREFDRETNTYPVNLVVQSEASKEAGYNAEKTGTYKVVNLTFDPTAGFHEYRFDYLPGRVLFYADSQLLAEMDGSAIPSSAGHLILQHWSNGNPLWSGGPPTQDAFLTVSYVKAYFNTSDANAQSDWAKRCSSAGSSNSTVCVIPDVTAANASTGGVFLNESANDNPKTGGSGAVRLDGVWATTMSVALLILMVGLL